jgi:hypothetical protein
MWSGTRLRDNRSAAPRSRSNHSSGFQCGGVAKIPTDGGPTYFAASSRSSHQAKVDSRSGSGPNLNRLPVISEAITRTK